MTALNQLQATKNLLNDAQRIAYVGMCSLVMKEMLDSLKRGGHKEVNTAVESMSCWSTIIIDRLCKHMDIEARGTYPCTLLHPFLHNLSRIFQQEPHLIYFLYFSKKKKKTPFQNKHNSIGLPLNLENA
jgi:hypothetical protein